jgi:hypothetical protein
MTRDLLTTLKKLRLSGLADSLEIRLHEAATTGLGHREFLELLLQDELLVRNHRLVRSGASIARLPGSIGVPRPATRTMPASRINLQHKSLLLRE